MKQVVFIGLIGLLAGICLAERADLSLYFTYLLLAVTLCLIVIAFVDRSIFSMYFRVTLLFLCGCLLGLIRTNYSYSTLPEPILDSSLGIKQTIMAKVVTSVDTRDSSISFNVQPIIKGNDGTLENIPLVRITSDRLTDVMYGDVVHIKRLYVLLFVKTLCVTP